jgi:hypothetical protein
MAREDVYIAQLQELGVWNEAAKFSGFEMGVVNWSGAVDGMQLGILNRATGGEFLQVGLVNFNEAAINETNGDREFGYALPFVNWNW